MQNHCVLIVDDSPTTRKLLSFALGRVAGLTFVEAETGAQAMDAICGSEKISLVLLDLNMPVMGGFAFLEGLKKLQRSDIPPVIVVTTEGSQQDIERAMRLGAADYVTKPVQSAMLVAKITEVLKTSVCWP